MTNQVESFSPLPAGNCASTEQASAPSPPRRRWAIWAALVAGAVLVPVVWWASTTDPLMQGSGGYGVVSDVAPVASVRVPLGEEVYVATYVEGERVTLLFPLTNTGRVPVRVTEVFPVEDGLLCGWSPDRVETSVSFTGDYRPFQPFWLSPDEIVDLSVSGVFDCDGQQGTQQGLSSYDGVPVRWSLGGVLPRTSRVSTGYEFGWTEDPDAFLTDLVNRDAGIKGF